MNGLRFVDSITDFFRSPKWLINLLLGGVCFLIPLVGPLVLMGWHVTIFYGRSRRESGETEYWRLPPTEWPKFDFAQFVTCLQRGLWPFLVALVLGFVLLPVMMLCLLPIILTVAMAKDGDPSDAAMIAAVVLSAGSGLLMVMLFNLLLAPFLLRAYGLQDFKAAFSFQWVRDYLGRMWKEQLLVALFSVAAGLALCLAGYLMLCVGVYFTMGIAMFSAAHLQRQLLDLYLQRGGEPLAPAPSLLDQPPPPPWSPPPLPPS
ncbi:MAG: DUF4013 domain-containing protein [Verrucomicrobiales bacterium]